MSRQIFKIVIVAGSIRSDRQGIKLAHWLANKLNERGHDIDLIDPKEKELPFLDKMYKEYNGDAPPLMQELHERLEAADGFLFVTPEYNHSISAVLKNFIDHYQSEFLYKPAALSGYSIGGFGGVVAVQHLKEICIKLGMSIVPAIFTVSKVDKTFEETGKLAEEMINSYEKKADKYFSEFEWYLEALKNQRQKGLPN